MYIEYKHIYLDKLQIIIGIIGNKNEELVETGEKNI